MKYRLAHVGIVLALAIGDPGHARAAHAKEISVAQALAKAADLTRTVFPSSHVYPELEDEMYPGFYGVELHWDQEVEGGQVAAFLQIDKLNGNVIRVNGVTCYLYGHDKELHKVHPGGKLRLPDACI